jgi:hypothetical protein
VSRLYEAGHAVCDAFLRRDKKLLSAAAAGPVRFERHPPFTGDDRSFALRREQQVRKIPDAAIA